MAGLRAAKSNSRITKMSKLNIEVNVTKEKKGKTTHIICVLDRSGSMSGMTGEVIKNFNCFLEEQQALEGKAKLTLVIFDTEYDVLYDEVDIQKAKPLTSKLYFARGGTAMNDAIGRVLSDKQNKKKAIVMIHTDGHENASREFSAKQIKKLVKGLKKKWEFIFVGAGIDAMTKNKDYGFTRTLNANNNSRSYANQYDMMNATTAVYRSHGLSEAGAAMTANIVAAAAVNEMNEDVDAGNLGKIIDSAGNTILSTTTDTVTTLSNNFDDPAVLIDLKK